MGRQIAIIAAPEDERSLLRYLTGLSPIRVFRTFAPTPEALWLDRWDEEDLPGFTFSVWLQQFPWEPTYGVTGGPGCPPERAGLHYFANAGTAPVLEITRANPAQRRAGRIYWAQTFSAPEGLSYDAAAFSNHVDQVWRWVRKQGQKVDDPLLGPHYVLPGARSPATSVSDHGEPGEIT